MTMGKVLKLYKTIFTILHLVVVVVVVVVQLHTHNSLTGLAISTKLCEYNRFTYEDVHRHIECFVNNVVLVKQQQTASGNTL